MEKEIDGGFRKLNWKEDERAHLPACVEGEQLDIHLKAGLARKKLRFQSIKS